MQQQTLLNLDDYARLLQEQLDILNFTHETIMILSPDGRIEFWNKGAQEMYGFTEQEAVGQIGHLLLQTVFPKSIEEIQKEVLTVGRWDGELIHRSRDGESMTVLSRWVARFADNGELSSFVQIDRGINERKSAERKRLKDNQDRELKVQERIVEIEKSDSERELRVQERIVEIERSDSERELKVQERIVEIERSDSERELKVQERIVEIERSDSERELRVQERIVEIEKSDKERELKVQERIVELAESNELLRSKTLEIEKSDYDRELRVQERIVEIERSDSERELRVQERIVEIEKSDKERELKVQERIVELAASEELLRSKVLELERSNEELQQFAYVCSHDLQEPLRVISNYTQLLSKRYTGQLDDKADMFIAFAVDAAKRMQELINDLLAYSRLQTKAQNLSDVDCNQVVKRALANLEISLTETGAIVNYDALPTIKSDRTQLLQLFQNLINNSLKFRSSQPVVINITAREQNGEWLFAVQDNGIGFDMQFEERIFLIFQRLHRKEEYSGSGIGLAVCKKIVLKHGGRMWGESAIGQGATFFFTFPVVASE